MDSKSNEITAVPLLLKLLNLKGAVVTLDAMGTQREIAAQIRQAEGEYVLALKGNQGKLSQQVSDWFKQAEAKNWQGIEFSYSETMETGHHRIETRQVWAVPVSQLPPLHRQSQWAGLTTVVMVRSRRQLWNKTTTKVRFYISSLEADAQRHNRVIRSHWSIENSLHWVLDVTEERRCQSHSPGPCCGKSRVVAPFKCQLTKSANHPNTVKPNQKRP